MQKMKPKGKRGLIAVKRLGRNYKTGKFDRIAQHVAESERRRGVSAERAQEIGKQTAAKIYWAKVKARAMRRKK